MRLPDAWKNHLRTRDVHPALKDSELQELYVNTSRFRKAQSMADVLQKQGWGAYDAEQLSDADWVTVAVLAGVTEPSPVTRMLTIELMKDRAKQREGLMDEQEAVEFCRMNFTPAELYR
jgi:hypothetical protein